MAASLVVARPAHRGSTTFGERSAACFSGCWISGHDEVTGRAARGAIDIGVFRSMNR
jgi:hypothetical protein